MIVCFMEGVVVVIPLSVCVCVCVRVCVCACVWSLPHEGRQKVYPT